MMANIILVIILAAMVGMAVRRIYLNRKNGSNCSCCSGDCSRCRGNEGNTDK